MTNEQLYTLLRLYRERLLQIKEACKDFCCKDDQIFTGEIDRLAEEIYKDMKRLGFSPFPAGWLDKLS